VTRVTSKSRGVTANQVRDLLARQPSPDPEVAALTFARAYRFDDGRVLLVQEDGKGRLHESRTALLAMLGEIDARKPVSPFGALLPEGRDFAEAAAALAAEAGLPVPAGLSELDDAVRRIGVAKCRRPPVFGQLVAYAGETIIAACGGAWQMRTAPDGTTWEPWVVDGTGREHAPFGIVYKELAEWGPSSSLTGAVSGSLRPLRG
jgi:hypothetical protein